MEIKQIINKYFYENTYLVKYNNLNILIDPGSDLDKIVALLNNKLDYILLTHGHMDHFVTTKKLIELYSPKVYLNSLDLDFINGNIVLDPYFNKENYNFKFIDYSLFNLEGIKIINTPGHSNGSVCILFEKEKVLFSGDTLFKESFGRFDFPNGSLKDLKNSINNLFLLDESIVIYPGHGENTIVKDEKMRNIIKFY